MANNQDPAAIEAGLSEDAKAVCLTMREDYGWRLDHVANKAGLSTERTRRARIELRDAGIAEIQTCWDDCDGLLAGNFYLLTYPLGRTIRAHLQQETE